jgi:hypothetical protein
VPKGKLGVPLNILWRFIEREKPWQSLAIFKNKNKREMEIEREESW